MHYPRCNKVRFVALFKLFCCGLQSGSKLPWQISLEVQTGLAFHFSAYLLLKLAFISARWPIPSRSKDAFLPSAYQFFVLSPTLLPVPCCDLCWSALSCNSFIQNEDSLTHLYTNNDSYRLCICCKKLALFNKIISRIWAALQSYQFLWHRLELLRAAENLSF